MKDHLIDATKRAALLDLLGGDEAALRALLEKIEQTDKTAQRMKVAYKTAGGYAAPGRAIFEQLVEANERRAR